MKYIFVIIFILSIVLNVVLLKVFLSRYIGMIHVKDDFTWIELQSKDVLDNKFGIVTIEKH